MRHLSPKYAYARKRPMLPRPDSVVVVIVAGVCPACGAAVQPASSIAGTYDLVRADGHQLPVVLSSAPGFELGILGATLEVAEDGNCSNSSFLWILLQGDLFLFEDEASCTWRREASAIVVEWSTGATTIASLGEDGVISMPVTFQPGTSVFCPQVVGFSCRPSWIGTYNPN